MTKSPLLGICAGTQHGTAVHHAGADFLEVGVQGFLVPGDDDQSFVPQKEKAAILALPIRCANGFLPASLPCVGPAVNEAALLAYAANTFTRAASVGIGCVVFGSGGARNIPTGFPVNEARQQFVALLQQIAPLAERSGVTVVIEPLNAKECNFINTLEHGAEMVEACGHPSVALLADTFHMGFSGEGSEAVRRFGKYLRHIHLAAYPSRRYPGAEGTSFRGLLEALREVDYPGAVSVECTWGSLPEEVGVAVANVRRDFAAAGFAV